MSVESDFTILYGKNNSMAFRSEKDIYIPLLLFTRAFKLQPARFRTDAKDQAKGKLLEWGKKALPEIYNNEVDLMRITYLLDDMLLLYPGHEWLLELKREGKEDVAAQPTFVDSVEDTFRARKNRVIQRIQSESEMDASKRKRAAEEDNDELFEETIRSSVRQALQQDQIAKWRQEYEELHKKEWQHEFTCQVFKAIQSEISK